MRRIWCLPVQHFTVDLTPGRPRRAPSAAPPPRRRRARAVQDGGAPLHCGAQTSVGPEPSSRCTTHARPAGEGPKCNVHALMPAIPSTGMRRSTRPRASGRRPPSVPPASAGRPRPGQNATGSQEHHFDPALRLDHGQAGIAKRRRPRRCRCSEVMRRPMQNTYYTR
jgi:hypothetical protein